MPGALQQPLTARSSPLVWGLLSILAQKLLGGWRGLGEGSCYLRQTDAGQHFLSDVRVFLLFLESALGAGRAPLDGLQQWAWAHAPGAQEPEP